MSHRMWLEKCCTKEEQKDEAEGSKSEKQHIESQSSPCSVKLSLSSVSAYILAEVFFYSSFIDHIFVSFLLSFLD